MIRKAIGLAVIATSLAACTGNFSYLVPFPTKPASKITLTQTQVADLHRQVVLEIGHSKPVVFGEHAAGRHGSQPSGILVCLWADASNFQGVYIGPKLHFGVLDQNNVLTALIQDDKKRSAYVECRKYRLLPPR